MGRQPSLWKFESLITKKAPEIRGFFAVGWMSEWTCVLVWNSRLDRPSMEFCPIHFLKLLLHLDFLWWCVWFILCPLAYLLTCLLVGYFCFATIPALSHYYFSLVVFLYIVGKCGGQDDRTLWLIFTTKKCNLCFDVMC